MGEQQRFRGSLFDLLTGGGTPGGEGLIEGRYVTLERLRDLVRRDLERLFTCDQTRSSLYTYRGGESASRPGDSFDRQYRALRDSFPRVASSVLNYGVPSLAGRTLSDIDVERFASYVTKALEDFEPRIDSETLVVSVTSRGPRGRAADEDGLLVEIRGDLRVEPRKRLEAFYSLDLETGAISELGDERGGGASDRRPPEIGV